MAQSVKSLNLAHVMSSWFMSSSPTSGSLLSAQSLLWILCPPLPTLPFLPHFLSLKNKQTLKIFLRSKNNTITKAGEKKHEIQDFNSIFQQ